MTSWILEILKRLFCWLPRPYFILPDEAGVRITLGHRVKDLKSGWYIEIPLIHNFIKVNIALQGIRFPIQSVMTKDGHALAVRGAVRYRITNARKAIFETDDFDKSLEAVATGVIADTIAETTKDKLQDKTPLLDAITKALREAAQGWGIKIQQVYLPDFTKANHIRLLGETQTQI